MKLLIFTLIFSCHAIGQCTIKKQGSSIDVSYKEIIDSLAVVDQSVRKLKYLKARDYIVKYKESDGEMNVKKLERSQSLMSKWIETDSLVSLALIDEINLRGFPSKDMIGNKSFYAALEILIHFGLSKSDIILQPILDSAFSASKLSLEQYVYIVDCQNVKSGRPQLYCGCLPHQFESLTREQKDSVLVNRKRIGLLSIRYKYGGKWKEMK